MNARFEAISPDDLYKPIADLLPIQSSRLLDLGAGTGRDAAWLAEKGHQVLAVEPVDELRQAGMGLHRSPKIEWISDRLPALRKSPEAGFTSYDGCGFDTDMGIAWHAPFGYYQPRNMGGRGRASSHLTCA